MMNNGALVVLIAAASLSCSGMVSRVQGNVRLTSCRLGEDRVHAFCGELRVPENREVSNGRTIALRLAVLPATELPVEPDPVFFVAGGPGCAATDAWSISTEMFSSLNAHRDFVLVDQRGTGGSNKVVYPPLPQFTGLGAAEMAEVLHVWSAEALGDLDADPRLYTTALAMDDLDDVRAALGYDRINLYGNSYGATAVQVYLRRHERHVRSVVMDGGSLLDAHLFESWAPNAQREIEKVLTRCEMDAACRGAYPGVRRELDDLVARVRRRPVTIADPASGEPMLLTPSRLGAKLQWSVVDIGLVPRLPGLVHRLYQLVVSAESGGSSAGRKAPREEPSVYLMMAWSVMCSESWARRDVATVTEASRGTLFEEWVLDDARRHNAICAALPKGIADPADGQRVRSLVPVLILNGDGDPQDPPENVARATDELPNSLTVIVPRAAHTVVHLGCLREVMTDFVERGSAVGMNTACVDGFQPDPFELSQAE